MSGLVELESNFAAYLARLHFLLDPGNLPVALPLRNNATESIYGAFLHFTIDPDILEKTGDEVGAFSEQMKAIFGWKTRSTGDGIIPIKERGRALSAAVDVLSQYHKKHPNNAVIQKWGFDIGKGVEKVYQIHSLKVCHFSLSFNLVTKVGVRHMNCSFQLHLPKQQSKQLDQSVVHLPPLLACSHSLRVTVMISTHPATMLRYDSDQLLTDSVLYTYSGPLLVNKKRAPPRRPYEQGNYERCSQYRQEILGVHLVRLRI